MRVFVHRLLSSLQERVSLMFTTKKSAQLLVVLAVSLFASVAGAISPDDISGLKIWLKADSLSLNNNDPVVDWNDSSTQSGSASKATQSSASVQPIFLTGAINGLPAVRFEADTTGTTGDWMQVFNDSNVHGTLANFNLTSGGITVFAVVDANTSSGAGRNRAPIWGDDDGLLDFVSSSDRLRTYRDATPVTHGSPGPAGFHIATFTHSELGASQSNNVEVFANGASVTTGSHSNSAVSLAGGTSLVNLGTTASLSDAFFGGDVAELIVYDGLLSASQLNDVGYYLEQKYGLVTEYVPEPSTGILLVMGLFAIVRRRRRIVARAIA